MPVAFTLDHALRWTYLSPNASDVIGTSPNVLVGKSILSTVVHEDQPVLRNGFKKLTEEQDAEPITLILKLEGNPDREFFFVIAPTFDEDHHTTGYFGQISVYQDFEQSASRSPASMMNDDLTYRAIFESISEGIYFFDPRDMRVGDMNPAFERMLGYGPDELINIPVYVFINEDKETLDAQVSEMIRTGTWSVKHRQYIRKDGSFFDAEITASYIDTSGKKLITVFVRDIEDRKQIERALRQSEEQFRQFKDRVTDVIYRYNVKENVYEFLSPSVFLQTGYTVKEYSEDPQAFARRTTFAEDLPLVFHRMRQHLAKGALCGAIELQYRFIKKDGSIIWVSDQKSFEFDEAGNVSRVNGVVRNIAQQKAVEIQLRDSEEYFRTMFESSPDGLMIFDLPPTRIEINYQFTRMFGYEQHELGDNPWELLERIPPNIMQARFDRLEREGSLEYNAIHFTRSGRVLYCNMKCSRFHTSKGSLYCAVMRDMTEKRSLEFQLQQYSQQLEKLVDQRTQELTYYSERLEHMVNERTAKLEAVNKELEQFAYTISHDLRAPLVCIEGFSDLLREEVGEHLTDEHKEWLDIIISSTRRMNKLIADLLELARIGRVAGKPVEISVNELLEDIKQEFSFTIEKRSVVLEFQDTYPVIHADAQRVRQVFQNLISNAIKYNDTDEVRIAVRATESNEQVEFIVADNGMGIPEERKEEVFLLFRRLQAGNDVEGTGAGLTIVRKIVESLGGTIWVESIMGKGSQFHFTIPKS